MSFKIAVASTDGKVVNEHFGRAEQFLILQVEDSNHIRYLETREVEAPCNFGDHNENKMAQVVKVLSDCKYVLCAQIGPGAFEILKENHIRAVSIRDFILDAITQVLEETNE